VNGDGRMKDRRRRVGFDCPHSFVISVGHWGLEFVRGSGYDCAEIAGPNDEQRVQFGVSCRVA
jgi:hypothetical protein